MKENRRFDRSSFFLITILILLVLNFIYSISETVDYYERIKSGNDRWLQVENRIVSIEQKVNELEGELDKWKN